jgi:hypothetical protein
VIIGRRRLQPAQAMPHASGTATPLHVHWFRWAGEEPFGNGSHYRCRCGVVRSGF